MFIREQTNKCALTAGNKITGYSSRAALAKDMLVILLGKNLEIISWFTMVLGLLRETRQGSRGTSSRRWRWEGGW